MDFKAMANEIVPDDFVLEIMDLDTGKIIREKNTKGTKWLRLLVHKQLISRFLSKKCLCCGNELDKKYYNVMI